MSRMMLDRAKSGNRWEFGIWRKKINHPLAYLSSLLDLAFAMHCTDPKSACTNEKKSATKSFGLLRELKKTAGRSQLVVALWIDIDIIARHHHCSLGLGWI